MYIEVSVFYNLKRKRVQYKTLHPYCFTLSNGVALRIPKGYVTDFASIPWWARSFVNGDRAFVAAMVHDWLYDTRYAVYMDPEKDRLFADREFLRYMKAYGVPKLKRKLMYVAVRLGGKSWWIN